MCEVAILDPRRYSAEEMQQAAITLYEAMRHSLGVVVVTENDDNDKFVYETYKAVEPDYDELLAFFEDEVGEETYRVVIHGRLATTGAVTDEHAHPLEVDCDQCDVDYVVHNGIVRAFDAARSKHEAEGHTYNTEVDSEVIAHTFGDVPSDFDEPIPSEHSREPAFVLFNEDNIYVHGTRYHLTSDARMARKTRRFGPERGEENYADVILTPSQA